MNIKQFSGQFVSDKSKEVKGVEFLVGEGFYIRVARKGNEAAIKLQRELMSAPEVEAKRRAGMMDDETQRRIAIDVISSTVLVGWRGLTDDAGAEIQYSPERAAELLKVPDFFSMVLDLSERQESYRMDSVNDAADKLGNALRGN